MSRSLWSVAVLAGIVAAPAAVALPDAPVAPSSLAAPSDLAALLGVDGLAEAALAPVAAPEPPPREKETPAPAVPAVPDAPPLPALQAPPAPEAPATGAMPVEEPLPLPDLALPPLTLPALTGEAGVGGASAARLPTAPASAPAAPGAPAPAPRPPARPREPQLGSQSVGADMGARSGLGGALQEWAEAAFGPAFAWYATVPPAARQVLDAALVLLATGLATAGAYVVGFRLLEKDKLLDHTFRSQVLDLVRGSPGIHLREVARSLGLTTTNAAYHLRVLEKHGFVRSQRMNGRRVFVPAAGPEAKQLFLAQAMLRRDTRARVLAALAARPGSNQTALASATGQHQGAVGWHLRKLVVAGLVTEERTPRECRYRLTDLGQQTLAAASPRAAHGEMPAAQASGQAPA